MEFRVYIYICIYIPRDLPVFAVCRVKLYRHNHSALRTLPMAIFRTPVAVTSLANTVFAWKFNGSIRQVSFTKHALCNFTGKTITKNYKPNLCVIDKLAVAGELCKLARVTGPEFPPPLLSSRTLPASDWPVPRGAV